MKYSWPLERTLELKVTNKKNGDRYPRYGSILSRDSWLFRLNPLVRLIKSLTPGRSIGIPVLIYHLILFHSEIQVLVTK